MNQTIDYYNQNAQDFYADTVAVDMSVLYAKFLTLLPEQGKILDVGCGSGRDALFFKQQGHEVLAFDASESLCDLAGELLQQPVLNMTFNDIHWQNQFSGIWACASLLHCPENELTTVFTKLQAALIENGVMYVSFKYGDLTREKGGRVFTDLNEGKLQQLVAQQAGLHAIEIWLSGDNRLERSDVWLNCLVQKKTYDMA